MGCPQNRMVGGRKSVRKSVYSNSPLKASAFVPGTSAALQLTVHAQNLVLYVIYVIQQYTLQSIVIFEKVRLQLIIMQTIPQTIVPTMVAKTRAILHHKMLQTMVPTMVPTILAKKAGNITPD